MTATAIVVAAGEGRRIGGQISKSYLPIAGRPLVLRTLDRIFASSEVSNVVLVVATDQLQYCADLLGADSSLRERAVLLQTGAATRQQSVRRGLEKVAETDIVLIHDGARPFVSPGLIDRCIWAAAEKGAVVVGLPARDTIKVVGENRLIQRTPDRKFLWEIQTPQAFQSELIIAAHAQAERDGVEATDDAMVVERLGKPVFVLDGERTNIKITLPEDVWLADLMIREGRVS